MRDRARRWLLAFTITGVGFIAGALSLQAMVPDVPPSHCNDQVCSADCVWENGETICTDVCVPGGAELFHCAGGTGDCGTDRCQQY